MALTRLAMEPGGSKASRRKVLAQLCRGISVSLCNTPAVVRKSYVHLPLLEAYERGDPLNYDAGATPRGCTRGERLLLSFLLAVDDSQASTAKSSESSEPD
jgi:DNA topoisomerase-1